MITTLLVDDEQHCIASLSKMLGAFSDFISVVDTASSVSEAIEKTTRLQPQLVFLDVEINNATGFDYLANFQTYPFHVIFTTAFQSYATKAFRYSALDYLLKPIDPLELEEAVQKVKNKITTDSISEKISVLFENMQPHIRYKKIHIPTMHGVRFLDTESICYLRAAANYTEIFTKDGKKTTVTKTLKWFDNLLTGSPFFRIHRSYIVNSECVLEFVNTNGGEVILSDGTEIPVSIRRKEKFLKFIS